MKHTKPPARKTTSTPAEAAARQAEAFARSHSITLPPEWEHTAPRLWEMAVHVSAGARIGLTNYRNPHSVLSRLLLPAIAALKWLSPHTGLQVVDVGAGTGAIGLALALLCPSWHLTIVDRRQRAIAFADLVRLKMGLANVTVACADANNPPNPNAYDAALFRAVADLLEDLTMAAKWVKPGGVVVIWTKRDIEPSTVEGWEYVGDLFMPDPPMTVLAYRRKPQGQHNGEMRTTGVENSVDIVHDGE